MGLYDDSKGGQGEVFPDGGENSDANWRRTAPLITVGEIKTKHLFGIPLYSRLIDPETGLPQKMTNETIAEILDDAVSTLELETGLTLFPTQFNEKHPFDMHEYQQFGYFRLMKRPIMSIEQLTVTPSNDIDVYQVPLDWIETAYLHRGQINIIPLTVALNKQGTVVSTSSGGGAAFLAIFGYRQWIPAFWKITYTAGFPSGAIPKVINNLIGVVTAMEVLSMLASTYGGAQSASLAIDGFSQSQSGPGPAIFTERLGMLEKKRAMLVKKMKALYGTTLFSGNV